MRIVLALLCFAPMAAGVLNMDAYFVAQSLCTVDVSNVRRLQYFDARFGPLPPVTVDGGELLVSYPVAVSKDYAYEGTRYNDSRCSFCPYSAEAPRAEYFFPGGVRNRHTPMYGPCLDGLESIRMSCVQNLILYPPDFVGEYFYPEQRLVPRLISFPYYAHEWVEGSYPSSIQNQNSPTDYALGRGNAIANIQTLRLINNASGTENTTLSVMMQAPYLTNEQWPKWEQHFCRQGCHRDSQRQLVTVRPSDYQGKSPTLGYLNRRLVGGAPLVVVRCARCPPMQAGYYWGWMGNPTMAADPAQNLISLDCYPWFGSVPTIVARYANGVGAYVFNVTQLVNHSLAGDGVSYPEINGYVEGRACPPNTYNNACAHKHKYDIVNKSPPVLSSTPIAVAQPACTPCPAGGWHTGGRSGAWFCLPPQGQTMFVPDLSRPQLSPLRNHMNLHRDNVTNMSLLWTRRDILGKEFECGNVKEHCYQCASEGLSASATPDDFNREVILKHILNWVDCPSSFYCPTALDPPVACPAILPWSPPGSAILANCTCARGTYLSSSNACVACTDRSSCPTGQFLSGWTRCTQQDGATSPGVCIACANMPNANAAYVQGLAKEAVIFNGDGSTSYAGVCPFTCVAGARLTGSKLCDSNYKCNPIAAPLTGPLGTPVFSSALTNLRDGFVTSLQCGVQLNLSIAANQAANSKAQWPAVSASCAAVNADCAAVACIVTRNASYDSNYVCAPCPSSPIDGYFKKAASGEAIEISSFACRAACNIEGYYNDTANACLSCTSFDEAYCPPQYHLSGGGCYGSTRPFVFPMSNPSANAQAMCVQCTKNMPPPGSWLSLAQTPCEYKACSEPAGLGKTIYASTQCGNTSDIVTLPCVLSCASPSTYLRGQCQKASTGSCVACTANVPGSYIVANCSATADTEWAVCSVPGTFCPGDGSVARCPMNQTSSPGAASAASCYCPVGTKASLENGPCVAVYCTITDPPHAPGASYGTSSSYLALNEQQETVCLPCPSNSVSMLNDGIGLESCVCVGASWYMVDKQCVACPAPQACSGGYYSGVPDTCWRGVVSDCVCVPPPFTILAGAMCSPGPNMCSGGFDMLSSGAKLQEDSTGSAVYITPPRTPMHWSIPLRKNAAPTTGQKDYRVRHLAVTSDWQTWGDVANWQFIVWTVADPNVPGIFAAPAPPHGFAESDTNMYNPYGSASSAWYIVQYASSAYVIEEIAVAQWASPQTPGKLNPPAGVDAVSTPTHVGAVVRVIEGSTTALRLYVNALSVDTSEGKPRWDSVLKIVPLSLVSNASTVDLGHVYMSGSIPISTFLLAYNKPISPALPTGGFGVVAVSLPKTGPETVVSIDVASPSGRTLEAAAFMSTTSGVHIYMVFATTQRSVRMVRWNGGATTVEADELFFEAGTLRVHALHITRPDITRSPVFTALVETPALGLGQAILHPNGPPLELKVADIVQRTFTDMQGMPAGTHPSRLAPAIPIGVGRLTFVAAYGADIFSIDASQCMPEPSAPYVPRYWDGGQCLPHVCVRSRPCNPEGGQAWRTSACVCVDGYYVSRAETSQLPLICSVCPIGFYCGNGTKTACPNGMTSYAGASAASDCACNQGQFFYDKCESCRAGSWCPNRWDSVPCPGDSSRSTRVGEVYPRSCVCAPGTLGVACQPCPSGRYCPASTNTAVNFVAMAAVRSTTKPLTAELVCGSLHAPLRAYLSASGLDYLLASESERVLCQYVSARGRSMVAIMVQTDVADSNNNVINALPLFLGYNSTVLDGFLLEGIMPLSGQAAKDTAVAVNAPTACPGGKTPSDDRVSCVCSAGYELSGTQCTACAANRYKAESGGGVCVACPIGFYSAAAASACVSANGQAESGGGGDSDNTPIIVGASVGGVVAAILIVWGMYAAIYPAAA